ncbi:MAG: zinc-binding dehydrogenase [Ideonella sp.]|nr:zinc-binding dehydrogenase [Ideonella sp.]
MLVPDARYVLPYGAIDPLTAASAACSGLTAYSALRKLPPATRDDVIALIGAGGLLAALGLVRHLTPARVAVIDNNDAKLELARQHADLVLNICDEDTAAALRAFGGGGVFGVVDFVGTAQTLEWGMGAMRKGGTLIEVGLFGGSISLSVPLLPMRNLKLVGPMSDPWRSSSNCWRCLAASRSGRCHSLHAPCRRSTRSSRT